VEQCSRGSLILQKVHCHPMLLHHLSDADLACTTIAAICLSCFKITMLPTMQPYSFGMLFLHQYYLSQTCFCSVVALARHKLAPTTRSWKLLLHTLNIAHSRLRHCLQRGSTLLNTPIDAESHPLVLSVSWTDVSIGFWYDKRSSG
jgi:hypothetical protein